MPGPVEEASRLREELFGLKGKKDRLTAENKVALALRTEISELKTSTIFLVGSIHEVKARAVETARDPEEAQ